MTAATPAAAKVATATPANTRLVVFDMAAPACMNRVSTACRHRLDRGVRFDVMATVVLRVRLTGGERMDITYEEPQTTDEDELVEHVVSTLAEQSGVLRSRHGDRLVILYGRGVAAIEVAPRGAVL
ncbi:hypothetical protein [Phytohabitans sp. LJ34]|uniref:hypothetical protein n=1 Tax=Phytohabitans sp. LJ34 TaxID=3452217 RepID=UPI003F8A87F2